MGHMDTPGVLLALWESRWEPRGSRQPPGYLWAQSEHAGELHVLPLGVWWVPWGFVGPPQISWAPSVLIVTPGVSYVGSLGDW